MTSLEKRLMAENALSSIENDLGLKIDSMIVNGDQYDVCIGHRQIVFHIEDFRGLVVTYNGVKDR